MSCNCNTASKTCEPCAFCTPPGVTGLTTCHPIDPCEDKFALDCVLYSGESYNCDITAIPGQSVLSIIAALFQQIAGTPSTNDCCGLTGSITMTDITTTTSSTSTTSTTTTTTTHAPTCSYYQISNSGPRGSESIVQYTPCNCTNTLQITIRDTPIQICVNNALGYSVISGTINTPVNAGPCVLPPCPTTTTTTTLAPCTCNVYTVTNNNNTNIQLTYTECNNGNKLVTSTFGHGSWLVCACTDLPTGNIPSGVTISAAGAVCTTTPTTTTTTIDCSANGGTVTVLESFSMTASFVTNIALHIVNSTVAFRVDWGDGTATDYAIGSHVHDISHTYTGSYSGPITFYSTNLTGIIGFYDADYSGGSSAPLWPAFNCLKGGSLTISTTELAKLDGCVEIEILNSKTTGDVNNLPKSLTRVVLWGNGRPGSAVCDTIVNGNISNLPPLATVINIAGLNTLTGDIANLPTPPGITGGYKIYIDGYNTIWGDIQNLPTGATGSNYNVAELLGNNIITGNISNLPSDYLKIYFGGGRDDIHTDGYGNTVWGNLADINPNMIEFDVRGENSLTGNLSSINSTVLKVFYLRGRSTITGVITNIVAPNLEILALIDDLNLTTVSGNLTTLSSLFPVLKNIEIEGPQIVTCPIASIPNSLINFRIFSSTSSLSGNFSSLTSKTNLVQFSTFSPGSTVSGELTNLPSSLKLFDYNTNQTVTVTFTPPHTWSNPMQKFNVITGAAMSTTSINDALVSLATVPTWERIYGGYYSDITVKFKGVATGAGLAAKATLISKGVTVTITP